jgi:hypothetical protein
MKRPSLTKTHLMLAFAASVTIGSALAVPAGMHGLFDRPEANLAVTGNEMLDLAGLAPGSDPTRKVISLHATGSLTSRVRTEWTGSAVLARTLQVTLTDSTGRVMYQGPFDGARVGDTAWGTALDLRRRWRTRVDRTRPFASDVRRKRDPGRAAFSAGDRRGHRERRLISSSTNA